MMRYLIGLALVTVTIYSCGQTRGSSEIEGLKIDPEVKHEAKKNFKKLDDFDNTSQGFQIFENNVILELYENDSLIFSTHGTPKTIMFKSFYLWKGDTLFIDGGIGLFGSSGFSIKIINDKATVYHMLSSDEYPAYAYGDNTKLMDRLEVPCYDVKAILSEIPEKGKSNVIYGYVEFKSDNYYSSQETVNGKEPGERKKSKSNMKMYFKSGEIKL
jgi:hypothetical protein